MSVHPFHLDVANILLWGLLATVAMTTILQASTGLGLSRLSLSYLTGTFITGNRALANVWGFVLYTLGGWLFALLYVFVFMSLNTATWWTGGLLGVLHGLFLLVVILPLLPYIHPRMATEYDGPTTKRRLEPPGFMGLNYGFRTPVTTLIAQFVYGAILGAGYHIPA